MTEPAISPFPNRKLGFEFARTPSLDAYCTKSWAAVALSNLRVGDAFEVGHCLFEVTSITEKTIQLKGGSDVLVLRPESKRWYQFLRAVGAELSIAVVSQSKNALLDVLARDPAWSPMDGQNPPFLAM